MVRYKILLSSGRAKTVKAKSAKAAKGKYYSSAEHLRTEDSIVASRKIRYRKRR